MRKKNLKPMIISALLAVGFGATSVGTSFALFTDKADTSISVTSGLVDIESVAKLVRYHSSIDNAEHEFGTTETSYTNTVVGTTFGLTGNTISINKMVPGDELTFSLKAINKSNVRTKTRYTLAHALLGEKADLFPALTIEYSMQGNSITNDQKGQIFRWKENEAVAEAKLAEGVELHTILVTVKFPNDDNEIRAREEGENNKYQDAACSITFGLEAVQANANTDPIAEINAYLNAKAMMEGHNATMHDAVNDMNELGYTLGEFVDFGAYVWSVKDDQFVAEAQAATKQNEYFKVYSEMPTAPAYSVYARNVNNSWTTASVELDGVGFDAGDVDGITAVSYTNSGAAKTNIIRTNSYDTSVTINASGDVVKHYGDASNVNIIAVAGNSYHEFGRVAFTEIATGRIVLEAGSETKQIHLNAYDGNSFDDITIANNGVEEAKLPEKITRDQIEVTAQAEKELVVVVEDLVNNTQENVYAYPYAYEVEQVSIPAGTTEKTQIQNADVETALGMKVIDSNNHDGEKALAAEEKKEAKEQVIEETITEDALDKGGIVRIGAKYFSSFRDALDSIDKDDVTVRVIDKEASVPAGTNQYVLEHKNLTIHVEEGSTLTFPEVDNENMSAGWNNEDGFVAFEGKGTVRFAKNENHPIVQKSGVSGFYVTAKDCTFVAEGGSGSYGYITDGSLIINGGKYKDVGFINKPVINDGMFTLNIASYLPEGKVCVATSDPTYPYGVAYLTEEDANFSLLHNDQYFYFTTPRGVTTAAVTGDTIKFIGDELVVTAAQGNTDENFDRFMSPSGVTYDLNGHTIQTRMNVGNTGFDGVSAAFELDNNASITVKNGTLNAYKLSYNPATIVAHNLTINDSCLDAMDSIKNGIYVKNSDTTFAIVDEYNGAAQTDYSAKIERSGADISNYYFANTCTHPVKEAMAQLKSGDHAYVYAYEEDATAYLPVSTLTTTITKIDGINFPKVEGKDGGEVTPNPVGNTCTYTVAEAPFCYIKNSDKTVIINSYRVSDNKTLQNALNDLSNGQVLVLNSNINVPEDVNSNGYTLDKSSGNYTIDFNGYTITRSEGPYNPGSHAFLVKNLASGSVTFDDSSTNKNGGIYCKIGSPLMLNAGKNSTASAYFKGGNFISDLTYAVINNNSNNYSISISGGTYINSYTGSFEGGNGNTSFMRLNGSNSSLSISGGTFSRNPSNGGSKVSLASGKNVTDNGNGTFTVQ